MGVAADADADADAGALAEPPPPDAGVLACVVSISCDVNFEKDPDDEKVVVSYKSHASANGAVSLYVLAPIPNIHAR